MTLKQSLVTVILLLALCGCNPSGSSTAASNVEKQAAEQATAIIQSAQATANALTLTTPVPQGLQSTIGTELPVESLNPVGSTQIASGSPEGTQQSFKLLSVGLAADGGFVMVYYSASPDLAHRLLLPGAVSVTNEKTGFTYNQIPDMEEVGSLISIPKANGQKGYVMLIIPTQAPLKKGDQVTVILADLKQQHVVVQ